MPIQQQDRMTDQIIVSDLALHLPQGLGPSAFSLSPAPPCPLSLIVSIDLAPHVIPSSTSNDTFAALEGGVNYSAVSKAIYARVHAGPRTADSSAASGSRDTVRAWRGPRQLAQAVGEIIHEVGGAGVEGYRVKMSLGRAVLQAQAVEYSTYMSTRRAAGSSPEATAKSSTEEQWMCTIRDIRARTIIGLHPHERHKRQMLELDVTANHIEWTHDVWDHVGFTDSVVDYMEASSFGTLEALAESLAQHILSGSSSHHFSGPVDVEIRKPSALPFAIPSVHIQRSRPASTPASSLSPSIPMAASSAAAFVPASTSQHTLIRPDGSPRIFIALGGNIGDRIGNITRAVTALEAEGVKVVDESRLYESEPMYVEDQARFTNGAIEVQTALPPLELLQVLKRVEATVGRTPTFRNGPRVVDLDLLIYGPTILVHGTPGVDGWLELPHPRIVEREFVLRPLLDIDASLSHPSPALGSLGARLRGLLASGPSGLAPVIPFLLPAQPLRLEPGRTAVMQIFNATPDSFSDGSADALSVPRALERIKAMWAVPHPPAILDIGGQSTAPNAPPVSAEEEIGRTVPLIRAIRASDDPVLRSIPISIDTFRPAVATAAVEAGASMINDVYTAREDGMAETMQAMGVPLVIMHSRGDSKSMLTADAQDYAKVGGVVQGVRTELGQAIGQLRERGVRRWNVVLDPGLGFAKKHEDSIELLRRFRELRHAAGEEVGARAATLRGYPWLIGGSRKRFVGQATGRTVPSERGYGDAAVTAWAAKEGAELVRVHEGREMGDVLRMWEAIERGGEVKSGS